MIGMPGSPRLRLAVTLRIARHIWHFHVVGVSFLMPTFSSKRRSEAVMQRSLALHVSAEMIALWLLEFVSCFTFMYVLFAASNLGGLTEFNAQAADRAVAFSLTIGVTATALGLYRPEICLHTRRLLISSSVAALLAFPAILVVGRVLSIDIDGIVGPDPFWPLKSLFAWTVSVFACRCIFSLGMFFRLFVKRVAVIGSAERASEIAKILATRGGGFLEVDRVIAIADRGALAVPALRAANIWGVVLTAEARSAVASSQILDLARAGIQVYDETDFRERQLRRIDLETLAPDWLAYAKGALANRLETALRRFGDLCISFLFLLFTLPLMVVTAILIKLDSPGPILYRQERVGLHGQPFTLLKFRSMSADAETGHGPSWALQRDPRITRIGSFIRRVRIDELPQLLNVLRGEMSFIGPRPERPHFVDTLTVAIPNYRDRSFVKPGLTGWAQVNFPYGASIEDARMKLSYDLYYVRYRSIVLDIMILFSTVRVILFQEGAR